MHHRALASCLGFVALGVLVGCSAADSSGSPVTSHPAPTSTAPAPAGTGPKVVRPPTGGVAPGTVGTTGHNPVSEPPDDAGTVDAGPDAPPLIACEGSGWVPPNGANCNSSSNDGNCSTTCMGGTKFWEARCQDGMCQCLIGLATMCECRMLAGTCKPCCPGMP